MTGIIETRTLKISNRIIKSQDIRRLFTDLENEFRRLDNITEEEIERVLTDEKYKKYSEKDKEREKQLLKRMISKTLKVKAVDGSIYEGHSKEILANGGILDTKQIGSLDFYFNDYNHNLSISINLRHTNFDNYNEVTVQGIDSLWVNGIIQKIENFLESIEKQTTWIKRYSFLVSLFFGICIAIVTSNLLLKGIQLLNSYFPSDPNSNKISVNAARTMLFIMMAGFSSYPSMSLTDRIKELWPTVELQTGQDYNQVEKHKRKIVWLIFSIIIIPTILTILTDLLS